MEVREKEVGFLSKNIVYLEELRFLQCRFEEGVEVVKIMMLLWQRQGCETGILYYFPICQHQAIIIIPVRCHFMCCLAPLLLPLWDWTTRRLDFSSAMCRMENIFKQKERIFLTKVSNQVQKKQKSMLFCFLSVLHYPTFLTLRLEAWNIWSPSPTKRNTGPKKSSA